MPVDLRQQANIEAAFGAAQRRTRAPIVCVLARSSGHYEFAALLWSGLIGLMTPWPLMVFTQLSAQRIFIAQLAVCFAATAILSLTPLRLLLTPIRVRRANAHRAALAEFSVRGLDRASERNGVLIYVSLAERYARVVAAESAAQAIAQGQWQGLVDALTADLRDRGSAEALTNAAGRCADLLAPIFPPASDAPPQHRQHFHVV
jgi:putative membrane protein